MITLHLELYFEKNPQINYTHHANTGRLYVTFNDFSKALTFKISTIFKVPIGISTHSAKIIVFTQSTDIGFPN